MVEHKPAKVTPVIWGAINRQANSIPYGTGCGRFSAEVAKKRAYFTQNRRESRMIT
jgi:hypothetical protein